MRSMPVAAPYARSALARSIFIMILSVIGFALIMRVLIERPASARDEPFTYSFHVDGILEEAPGFASSGSEYWWLDSGGRIIIEDGVGKTLQGALPVQDPWRRAYAESSAEDTGGGRYPQNLFRLVTQGKWQDVAIEARFRIVNDNDVASDNRNESNGLLLMSRYIDGDNLYYAGVRVDGHAVIKKKHRGEYRTLAEKPVFPGGYEGANLLPHDEWIHQRSETRTQGDAVEIRLFMRSKDGWIELLSALDTTDPILSEGHAGIRTDFMDVEFDDFRAETI